MNEQDLHYRDKGLVASALMDTLEQLRESRHELETMIAQAEQDLQTILAIKTDEERLAVRSFIATQPIKEQENSHENDDDEE